MRSSDRCASFTLPDALVYEMSGSDDAELFMPESTTGEMIATTELDFQPPIDANGDGQVLPVSHHYLN